MRVMCCFKQAKRQLKAQKLETDIKEEEEAERQVHAIGLFLRPSIYKFKNVM